MSEQKKNLQDFFEKARGEAPVTSANELRTLLEQQGAASNPAPTLNTKFWKGTPMQILGSAVVGTILVGTTALFLSHKTPILPNSTLSVQRPQASVSSPSNAAQFTSPQVHNEIVNAAGGNTGAATPTAPTPRIPYQGMLTEQSGAPMQGVQTFVLNLYASDSGGPSVWRETQSVHLDDAGGFNINLGDKNPLVLPSDGPYWMGLSVNGNAELRPLMKIEHIQNGKVEIKEKVTGNLARQGSNASQEPSGLIEQQTEVSVTDTSASPGEQHRKVRVRKMITSDADRKGTFAALPPIAMDDDAHNFGMDNDAFNALRPWIANEDEDCLRNLVTQFRKRWVNDSLDRISISIGGTPYGTVQEIGTADEPAPAHQHERVSGVHTLIIKDKTGINAGVTELDFAKPVVQNTSVTENVLGQTIQHSHMLELDRNTLAKLGVFPDDKGIWLHVPMLSIGVLKLDHIGTYGIFDGNWAHCRMGSLPAGNCAPTMISDEHGMLRQLRYDPLTLDSAVTAKMLGIPPAITDEHGVQRRFKYDPSAKDTVDVESVRGVPSTARPEEEDDIAMTRRGEMDVLKKMSTLIPVHVKINAPYTAEDKRLNRWRPDVILWYEPTPEFLAAIPQEIRGGLEAQVNAVACMIEKIDSGKISPDCQSAIDRATSEAALAKENSYFDLFRAASGAVTSALVYPNPAVDKISIQYKLSDARTVKVSLFDIQGRKLRDLAGDQTVTAGEHSVDAVLEHVTPGIYLLAVTTEKGEQAVQRLIVVDRR